MKCGIVSKIVVLGKKYEYSIIPLGGNSEVHLKCEAAGLDQDLAVEDLAQMLLDLPDDIIRMQSVKSNKEQMLRIRVSKKDKEMIERAAVNKGYESVSEYIRFIALS
jgi:hypothetical protein